MDMIMNTPLPTEECSTGVVEDGICQPVGSGYNPTNGQPYPETFPIGDLPDSCADAWVLWVNEGVPLSGDCVLPVDPTYVPFEAATSVVSVPQQVTLPATGPGDVAMIAGSIGIVLVVVGQFLRRVAS